MNEATKAIIRTATNIAREQSLPIAKKFGAFLLRHKAGVVIVVLLIYILWQKSALDERRDRSDASSNTPTAQASPLASAIPQPGVTTPPELQFFDSKAPDADPKWGLPAQLSTNEIRDLAAKVDKLARSAPRLKDRLTGLKDNYRTVADLGPTFWDRLRGQGFQDKELPLDWNKLATAKAPISFGGKLGAELEEAGESKVLSFILSRLEDARMNLIGGKQTVGDTLFINKMQNLVDSQEPQLMGA
jgi:hypothetical protein